jgi:hypothetical protein
MNKKTKLALSISGALFAANVNAASKVADARGNAMGNTGVASADYLTAPFYNPALGASFRNEDDFGILLPAVGASVSTNATEDTLTTIEDMQDLMDEYEDADDIRDLDESDADQLDAYLDELDDGVDVTVTADLGLAIAFPTKTISANLFALGYTEVVADVTIDDNGNAYERYNSDDSYVDMRAFGYAEVGLALAKEFAVAGERVSFGVTPKYQSMTTYAQRVSIEEFDIEDYDESEISKDAFNFDLGAAWYLGNFRAGVAVKDLFAQEIAVSDGTGAIDDTYNLDTQITAAVAYTSDYFTAAVDADLTKQTRFASLDDDTQFVRFGLEGNAWGWAQLRAGYEIDLQDTVDNTITAGIGISPFDVVSIDVAGAYTKENNYGASLNLAFTF